ncbi:hypothetical protein J2Z83_003427 [Virgibacillus natechei]|uniref:Uncharacterized protein n=1 Tax=Virgibacillus natechei TaxID=1216297 RepID=A0ABS4IKA4_9BACI|nr:hypothetical protein [Virgibacillus natechei]MBP1971288.1 hypothetical protein [Virgibacillus natechei]UZD12087.1 hypothetical protein OLD84_14240 [Virgibacillus natechei]
MVKLSLAISLAFMTFLPMDVLEIKDSFFVYDNENTVLDETQHNWEEYSTDTEIIHTGSHEYTYWKNFGRESRTCNISHKIKTVVYYCDVHDHTYSETFLEETIHSEDHTHE